MATAKPPKKSETIEVRLSHEAKTAFLARCRNERRTASAAIRSFIDREIDGRAPLHQSRPTHWRIVAAAVAGAVVGTGAAAPSFAHTTQVAFDQLDRNHDRMLTYEEFRAR